jgi:hypothetical protein
MNEKSFILDTNTFITPYRSFYGLDFCPGFWDFLDNEFVTGRVVSIEKVWDEIVRNDDPLSEWLRARIDKTKFIDTSNEATIVDKYEDIALWVNNNQQFLDYAKRSFLQPEEADPWIGAYAAVAEAIVVTQETLDLNIHNKVKLPNVLKQFDVEYIDLFQFLRMEHAKFSLAG